MSLADTLNKAMLTGQIKRQEYEADAQVAKKGSQKKV